MEVCSMEKFVLFIIQLPQNIAGLLLLGFHFLCGHKPKKVTKCDVTVWMCKHVNDCGVSLGDFILLDSDVYHGEDTFKHEHGHQIQSIILGWLYLPSIGLLSATGNLIFRIPKVYKNHNYYKQPWEAWADKLGGVNR